MAEHLRMTQTMSCAGCKGRTRDFVFVRKATAVEHPPNGDGDVMRCEDCEATVVVDRYYKCSPGQATITYDF